MRPDKSNAKEVTDYELALIASLFYHSLMSKILN